MTGPIGARSRAPGTLNAANLESALAKAFAPEHKAVAICLNSPGGSPVQSSLLYKRIVSLKTAARKANPEHRVLAFVEDAAASGGYYIAAAADEIFADESSIVGSIGVISGSFGLKRVMAQLGVDPRRFTAGKHKARMDPFKDMTSQDMDWMESMLADLHANFIKAVREGRQGRLKGAPEELFSGDVWLGARALEKGLIDGLGDMHSVCRARFGDDVKFTPISARKGSVMDLFAGVPFRDGGGSWGGSWGGEAVGRGVAAQLLMAAEEEIAWSACLPHSR
jgi:serine protease SohB